MLRLCSLVLVLILSLQTSASSEEDLFPTVAPSAEGIINLVFAAPKSYFRKFLTSVPQYAQPDHLLFSEVHDCHDGQMAVFKHQVTKINSSDSLHSKKEVFDISCRGLSVRFLLEREAEHPIVEVSIKDFLEFEWYELEGLSTWRLQVESESIENLDVFYKAGELASEEEKPKVWTLSFRAGDQERPLLGVEQKLIYDGAYQRRYQARPDRDRWASVLSEPTQQNELRNYLFSTEGKVEGLSPTDFQTYLREQIFRGFGYNLWLEGNVLPVVRTN